MLYLMILRYLRPLSEVDAHLEGHKVFLRDHFQAGHFLLSGRREPRDGGVILAKADSREQAEAWAAEDPFARHGVASYEIIGWVPSSRADSMPDWLIG